MVALQLWSERESIEVVEVTESRSDSATQSLTAF